MVWLKIPKSALFFSRTMTKMPNRIRSGKFFCGPFCFDFIALSSKKESKVAVFVDLYGPKKPYHAYLLT